MKRFFIMGLVSLFAITAAVRDARTHHPEKGEKMQIIVRADGSMILFTLNDSLAAEALYDQLPLSIEVEDYGRNEKIFYPPKQLPTADTPPADARAGTLAYYAPWGNVVMFYADFGTARGLYALGHAVSGAERIKELSGIVTIERVPR